MHVDHCKTKNKWNERNEANSIQGGYIASIKIVSSDDAVSKPLSSGGTAAVFFFYLWTAFYTPSWNGTPWVLNSEMFDQTVRSLGQASAAANNWFW